MRLSIVIPAYNEEARIGPMLEAYAAYFLPRYGTDAEFIVVVNGSTDRTDEVANSFAAKYPAIRTVIEPRKIGKGGAIVLGFQQAKGDLVGFVDADNATPPEAYQDLVDKIGDAGAIIASRWLPESKVSPKQPLSRRIASRIFNVLVDVLFKLNITDTQCGAKLMQRKAVLAAMPELGVTRWAFDVDLLFQLRRLGYRIVEVPTVWRDVEGSQLKVVRVSIEMFMAICRLRMLYSPLRWIVKLYERTLGQIIHLKV